MAESIVSEKDEDGGTSFCVPESTAAANGNASRKVKRKVAKKEKRKQIRKELAEKARAEEEARLNDPEEQRRIQLEEERENERLERDRREFEEREKLFLEELARQKAEEEEEERKKAVEEKSTLKQIKGENELNEDDEWEYVEEGPPEIIWQGNEIIVKKNRVKVKKIDSNKQIKIEDDPNRPTSNPLPPQSEAYTDYKDASKLSAQQLLENVAQQVPNFGTEQDKAHCPFHIKTGACRFGLRCSRVHFYPDKSCTLLVKNMYTGPGLAWEQDEGLEYMDEEVERCYEEFYEDVHTEFLKFGEIVNFKVCRNGSFHLRGNVYIHYKSLESAVLAYHAVNGRYFAGKQVNCEFVSVTKWRIAICGEYLKSRLKTCSRGTACNFLHCFGNPGGDYEWADWDRPPPRYWVKKMTALFGHSDEYWYDRDQQMERESPRERRYSSRILAADRDRYHSRRSRSREADRNGSYGRSLHEEHDFRKSTHQNKHTPDDRKQLRSVDQKNYEEEAKYGNNQHGKNFSSESASDGGRSVRDTDWDGYHDGEKRRSRHENKRTESRDFFVASRSRTHERGSGEDLSISDRDIDKYNGSRKRSSHRKEVPDLSDDHAESEHSKLEEERARKRSRSSRRGRLSSEASEVSSPEELTKSSGHHDTNSSSRSRLRIKSNDSDSRYDYNEDVDNVGHRESDNELLPDKHKRSKRKSTVDGTAESNSAHRYYDRHKSQDTESYHHDEDNGERDRWKPDKSPEKDHHNSRRLLGDDRERHRQSTGSRSRSSRWSSRDRWSDSLVEGVDSAEELQKVEDRSHGHSHKGKQKESISEKHT